VTDIDVKAAKRHLFDEVTWGTVFTNYMHQPLHLATNSSDHVTSSDVIAVAAAET